MKTRKGLTKRIAAPATRVFKAEPIVFAIVAALVTVLLWMTIVAIRNIGSSTNSLQAARAVWHDTWQSTERTDLAPALDSLHQSMARVDSILTSPEFAYLARVSPAFNRSRDYLKATLNRLIDALTAGRSPRGIEGAEARAIEERFDLLFIALSDLADNERSSFVDLLGFIVLLILALAFGFFWQGNQVRSLKEKVVAERDFSLLLDSSIEEERIRIAREIHDDIAQDIVFARHELDSLALDFPSETARLSGIKEALGVTLSNARALCEGLRPPRLDSSGSLIRSILGFCKEVESRASVIVDVTIDPDIDCRIGTHDSLSLFRIIQEGVTNACKHSQSRRITVALSIERTRKGDEALIVVEDEGIGMSGSNEGLGIRGLRERARLLGGSAAWENREGGGTSLCVRAPLDRSAEREKQDASTPSR